MRALGIGYALGGVLVTYGVSAGQTSDLCTKTVAELQDLLVNKEQEQNGVEGNTLVTNDCKALVDANVMDLRTDEEQQSLCGNSCYGSINSKYKVLLDNDCFASNDTDKEASAKLQAAAYQIACQTNANGKYCIPMLGELVKAAGTSYDLCDDIVSELGCCFQSYRQYMLLGTPASVTTMDDTQNECTKAGVGGLDVMCSCSNNQNAFTSTTFCSYAMPSPSLGAQLIAIALVTLATVIAWQ
ncbi:hypothetical protein PHYBOEH_012025 [Phytophthora boehmeriae]|uniref:Elicitin n=1 Tax=Phytophthora boehmeriae TaxID=109152 RepID=A0A8T1WWT9_9STRA|nr:hypothetical protein PHYBOEH_012025 [Phytophthora boehmeriae]